jgi:two-component system sensor histidine kinase ChvG
MRTIRWKLILMSLLIVFIPIYFINRYALLFFDRFTRSALESDLKHYAFIVGEQYKMLLADGAAANAERFQSAVQSYGQEIQSRMQIVDTNGLVLFDSDPETEGRAVATRPEIRAALSGAYSARCRLTEDRQFMFYYIACPIKDARKNVVGVAYVVRHTGPIIRALQQMIGNQRLATALALLLAAVAAALLAQTLTRRLRRLTKATKAFAAGAPALDAPARGADEIAELGRAVAQMAEEIRARNAYNRDFMSATMHELRTPLTAIKGAVELLEQGAAQRPDAARKFLGNIRHQTERMIRMSAELLQLTRLDAEIPRARKDVVDYGRFVREAAERLQPTFAPVHAAFAMDVPDTEFRVALVPDRIEQVLANLLENAFRYTPPDGRVDLVVRPGPDRTVLTTVADTGCGISAANLPKVFDRFFTTEAKDGSAAHGSGLGLAIARSIVEGHRGRIEAQSEPGHGARFTFALPLAGDSRLGRSTASKH